MRVIGQPEAHDVVRTIVCSESRMIISFPFFCSFSLSLFVFLYKEGVQFKMTGVKKCP